MSEDWFEAEYDNKHRNDDTKPLEMKSRNTLHICIQSIEGRNNKNLNINSDFTQD